MPRPFRYHVWDDSAFNGLPALAPASIPVIPIGGGARVPRLMYSLKRDLIEMRRIGVQKGIVDGSWLKAGDSAGGRELWGIKVGTGSSHKVVVVGCHHAREWISLEMAYYIAEYLINTHPGSNAPANDKEKRIKHLLLNRQIWFVPLVNPDGHAITITTDRGWRQNNASHTVPAGSVARPAGVVSWPAGTYTGVDINRNYATTASGTPGGHGTFLAWGTETFLGGSVRTSRDPRDSAVLQQVWCGPSAGSENETSAIQTLVQGARAAISFHSSGCQWLWPGPLSAPHRSDSAYVDWVGDGTVAIMGTAGAGARSYTYTGGPVPYPTSGDMADFTYQATGFRPSYTPELRPNTDPPVSDPPAWDFSGLPEAQIEPCFRENLAATLAVINCAGHNAQSTTVPLTTTTGAPPQRCQYVLKCWEVFRNWTP
jgi:carboxypeptidase T